MRSLLYLLLCTCTVSAAVLQHPFLSTSLPVHANQQPDSSSPVDYPYRELPWGEVNILHTTDTHGWLLGHQRQEASFSGDWGDLVSFVTRMKAEATRRGVDLLVVDSGDRVDGNGLVDAEPEGHVKGWTAMKYFSQMPYDVITTGNHELYKYPTALSTYQTLVQHYGRHYLTSNVNITLPSVDGAAPVSVPIGHQYAKFKTEQGKDVTALGPLFFFKAHAPGTTVQHPREMIKESWFLDAISEQPDFFLLVGHMSIQAQADSEWTAIFNAIRAVHPTTPILIFGGHHHIRDCKQEDSRSMSLASGRYMETVGFMSVSGLDREASQALHFERRYLDQNRNTLSPLSPYPVAHANMCVQYKYHAGADFDTKRGQEISVSMTKVAVGFNLTHQFGTAPHSYYLSRYAATSEQSILNLMVSRVLPLLVRRDDRPYPHFTILNSGSIRFDIFKGPFTKNDQWIISPFTNNFNYIPGVPPLIARELLAYLNIVGEHGFYDTTAILHDLSSKTVEAVYRSSQVASYEAYKGPRNLTWGYVTLDACPGLGDDTLHMPLPAHRQPTFVATDLRYEGDEATLVDVVFFDFIMPDIVSALNVLQSEKVYGSEDVELFVEGITANTLMQEYAAREWS